MVLQQHAVGTTSCPCTRWLGSGLQGVWQGEPQASLPPPTSCPALLPTTPSTQCMWRVTQKGGSQVGSISSSASSSSFLEQSSAAQARRFYPGENQPPHGTGQVCVCTAVSSQCRSARWQTAQARASQTLLAFVSMQSEFSYIPQEMQSRRAPSAQSWLWAAMD